MVRSSLRNIATHEWMVLTHHTANFGLDPNKIKTMTLRSDRKGNPKLHCASRKHIHGSGQSQIVTCISPSYNWCPTVRLSFWYFPRLHRTNDSRLNRTTPLPNITADIPLLAIRPTHRSRTSSPIQRDTPHLRTLQKPKYTEPMMII